MPILGGDRWFKTEHRIPILERIDRGGKSFYKVVLPIAGVSGREVVSGKISIINPEQLNQNAGLKQLMNMKKIDVLFLIDGTRTMDPYINRIKGAGGGRGTVQEIMDTLQRDPAFREAQFRFGFRIYRDAYAGIRELGEGLPMSPRCGMTHADIENNKSEFNRKIRNVEATNYEVGQDDYEENLFGGINQAIKDFCVQDKKCS